MFLVPASGPAGKFSRQGRLPEAGRAGPAPPSTAQPGPLAGNFPAGPPGNKKQKQTEEKQKPKQKRKQPTNTSKENQGRKGLLEETRRADGLAWVPCGSLGVSWFSLGRPGPARPGPATLKPERVP